MRALFDLTHPAHVHLFKHAILELARDGHAVRVTSREKDVTTRLLDAYGIEHTVLSSMGDRKFDLAGEWALREVKTARFANAFDPDVVVSHLNPAAVHAAAITGADSIVFNDQEASALLARLTAPLTTAYCTPSSYRAARGKPHRRYDGFHELAYLHPNRFTPDPNALVEHGVDPDDHYAVLRFVSWGAHHDVKQNGLSIQAKRELIEQLAQQGDVYITAERDLPAEFDPYRLPVPPELVHQLLYHANLYVGDSQTMATEAAVLGTPAVRSNSFAGNGDMSNFVELEHRYGLLYSTSDEAEALSLVRELLDGNRIADEWAARRQRLTAETVDVTEFMLDVIHEVAA